MKTITTVRGQIMPDELGFTTMHEHLLCDFTDMLKASLDPEMQKNIDFVPPEMLALTMQNLPSLRSGMGTFSKECASLYDKDYMVEELKVFGRMGGKSIVDATPIAIGPDKDAEGLKEISEKSDIHIVTCTGLYTVRTQPENYKAMDEDSLTDYFIDQLLNGFGDTGIKPGFMKCGIGNYGDVLGVDQYEIKAVRACARAAATGCSLHIHNGFPLGIKECVPVARMVLELGVKPEKLLMLHMDSLIRRPFSEMDYIQDFQAVKTVDIELMVTLMDMGINIGFDSWDMQLPSLPDNQDRLKALIEVLKRGYGDRIVLGHDCYDKSRGVSYGGTGYTGFIRNALPILKQAGFEEDIVKMTVSNPARILSF